MTKRSLWNLGETLAADGATRIHLCGRLVARIAGKRVEEALPGRQGRLLFAYLVVHRREPAPRSKLMDALWPANPPAAADTALSALLTKTRAAVGADLIAGKHDVQLRLAAEAWIDLEAASEALHRAESAVALKAWTGAWGPSRVALSVASRSFLPGYEAPWLDPVRTDLNDILLRAHECVAASGLGLAGPELASAERSARALARLAPYRESGCRILMEVLATRGNAAEALLAYEELRQLLKEQLGVSPSPATQALHKRLLGH